MHIFDKSSPREIQIFVEIFSEICLEIIEEFRPEKPDSSEIHFGILPVSCYGTYLANSNRILEEFQSHLISPV